MRLRHGLCALATAALPMALFAADDTSGAAAPQAIAPGHPVVGRWIWTIEDTRCAETYDFRADGTTRVSSGDEVAETDYQVSPAPSAKGYYKLVDTVRLDNGGRDCTGKTVVVPGVTATRFIRFHPSGDMFIECETESLERCFGPFKRARN